MLDYDISLMDPYDIKKGRLQEAHKRKDKEINDMIVDRTVMYACILS